LVAAGRLDVARLAEDTLAPLADAVVSPAELTEDPATRQKVVTAWRAWWRANEGKLDLARVDLGGRAGQVARARKIAEQAMNALRNGDETAFKRTLKLPIYMQGGAADAMNVVKDWDRIHEEFRMMDKLPEIRKQLKQLT